MKTYLKIKIKSLAAEARLIKAEERKWPGTSTVRAGLQNHRIKDVRGEARSALVAYGFLRGRSYKRIERTTKTEPDWERVEALVAKYGLEGRQKVKSAIEEWRED